MKNSLTEKEQRWILKWIRAKYNEVKDGLDDPSISHLPSMQRDNINERLRTSLGVISELMIGFGLYDELGDQKRFPLGKSAQRPEF